MARYVHTMTHGHVSSNIEHSIEEEDRKTHGERGRRCARTKRPGAVPARLVVS